MPRLTAHFVVEAEAERAMTQLRAVGIQDADMVLATPGPDAMSRGDDVGVPDSASGIAGLRGGEEATVAPITLEIELASARVGIDEIRHLLHAAGGRTA